MVFSTKKGDVNLVAANIKSGATIFGITRNTNVVDTSTGTAGAADIASGKTAFVSGSLVTGNVAAGANVAGGNGVLSFTIPNGLYNGSKISPASDTNLIAANNQIGHQCLRRRGESVRRVG